MSPAHEEGGEREYAIGTGAFLDDGNGHVAALRTHRVDMTVEEGRLRFDEIEGTTEDFQADLVLLSLGFTGPEKSPMLDQFGIELTDTGTVARDARWATNVDGVFVAGDMGRGQSLIVWAIAEGRACAASVDTFLMGQSLLPSPLMPATVPMR